MTSIELNPAVSAQEWHTYVENHPDGSLYHLPEWQEVLVDSFHHNPFYLFARNEEDKLCGILPLFQIKSALTGNRLVSLPFSHACGPIADSKEILAQLVLRAEDLCQELKCRYLELRMMRPAPLSLKVSEYFSTFVLELTEPEMVWTQLHQKGVRWAIGKARKNGVTVRVDNALNAMKNFDHLNKQTKRNLGVPAHPSRFLRNINHKLARFTKLYLAEFEDKTVAGIVTLSFKDTVYYAYGASHNDYLKYYPNDLLVWQAIEESCNQGYRYFDFGKTAPDNEGLVRFKKHWGTKQRALYYYYHPGIPNLISSNRSGQRYKFITCLWRRLPLFLSHTLSLIAFKHLD